MNISDQSRRIREYEFLLWEYKRNGTMDEVIKKLEDKINKLKQGKFEDEVSVLPTLSILTTPFRYTL
jgi:molybdopterin converting factor small subunit